MPMFQAQTTMCSWYLLMLRLKNFSVYLMHFLKNQNWPGYNVLACARTALLR